MNDGRLSRLRSLAVGFHGALDAHDFSGEESNLKDFPMECCHHACTLLTVFLCEQGFTDIQKRVGSRPDRPNGEHLWLVVDGAVVDITAYQFDDALDKAIVTKDSAWHTQRAGKPSQIGSEGEPLEEYVKRVKPFYDGLCEELGAKALRIISQ